MFERLKKKSEELKEKGVERVKELPGNVKKFAKETPGRIVRASEEAEEYVERSGPELRKRYREYGRSTAAERRTIIRYGQNVNRNLERERPRTRSPLIVERKRENPFQTGNFYGKSSGPNLGSYLYGGKSKSSSKLNDYLYSNTKRRRRKR